VHPHLFGVAGWLPFAPAVLEIADQLFLLAVDGDRRLAALLEGTRLVAEVGELGIAVGVVGAFLSLVLRVLCRL